MTLRELRELRGLSIRQLEERTGLNRGCLSQIERGIRIASGDEMVLLADALGIRRENLVLRLAVHVVGLPA